MDTFGGLVLVATVLMFVVASCGGVVYLGLAIAEDDRWWREHGEGE